MKLSCFSLQEANGGRKPKVLAATATIKEYAHHVKHLYQRKARRFPVPGYLLNESFYSRIVRDADGNQEVRRMFAGLLPLGTGRTMEKATAHVSSRFLTLVDHYRDWLKNDPAAACADLGFDAALAPSLLDYIETYLNANLIYVNSFQSLSDVVQALEDVLPVPFVQWQQCVNQALRMDPAQGMEKVCSRSTRLQWQCADGVRW